MSSSDRVRLLRRVGLVLLAGAFVLGAVTLVFSAVEGRADLSAIGLITMVGAAAGIGTLKRSASK